MLRPLTHFPPFPSEALVCHGGPQHQCFTLFSASLSQGEQQFCLLKVVRGIGPHPLSPLSRTHPVFLAHNSHHFKTLQSYWHVHVLHMLVQVPSRLLFLFIKTQMEFHLFCEI